MKGQRSAWACAVVGILAVTVLSGCTPAPRPQPAGDPGAGGAAMMPMPSPVGKASALLFDKSVPEQIDLGVPFTYEMTIQNVTKALVRDVIIVDHLPENFQFQSAMPAPARVEGNKLIWTFPSLDRNEVKAIRVSGVAIADGMIAYETTVTHKSEPTKVRQARLEIEKVGPARQFVNRSFEYVVTVRNTGDAVATNVKIEDTLPEGVELVRASDNGTTMGGRIVWQIDKLKPSEGKKVAVTLRVVALGSANSKATVTANWARPASAAITTALEGIPAVALELSDKDSDPVEVGKEITYTITATNQGTAPGTNLSITCTLDAGVEYMGASGSTGATLMNNVLSLGSLAKLEPGEPATWTVKVKALQEGDSRFRISLKSDQFQRPIEKTEATFIFK